MGPGPGIEQLTVLLVKPGEVSLRRLATAMGVLQTVESVLVATRGIPRFIWSIGVVLGTISGFLPRVLARPTLVWDPALFVEAIV